ncbi:hypothetical protein HRbin37_00415 [bacterium HR37]|jgi:hypothetical protein|nr:hypothetical protein HRbin37_00415 [bacterium HR37]
MEKIKGTVEKANARGIKLDGKWYNYSKFMEEDIPKVSEGDRVEVDISGDWIKGVKILSHRPSELVEDRESYFTEKRKRDLERQIVVTRLACLNTATEILKSHARPIKAKSLFRVAEELENWVWRGLKREIERDIEEDRIEFEGEE